MLNKLILLLLLSPISLFAQELNCRVTVNFAQIGGSDQQFFTNMENTIRDFLNTRRWTNDVFLEQERISCNITIILEQRPSTNQFIAKAQIQAVRPVFNASYSSVLINHTDPDWTFVFNDFEPLEFNETTHLNNLSSLLAYYVYIILGMDYDSFAPMGGTEMFQRAQTVLQNAQNAPEPGWKQGQNLRNRFWLLDNMISPPFRPFRESIYIYHMKGLDGMHKMEKVPDCRKEITNAIKKMHEVHRQKPGSMAQQIYLAAKVTEIIGIYSKATPEEKSTILTMLSEIDPSNILQYQKITSP